MWERILDIKNYAWAIWQWSGGERFKDIEFDKGMSDEEIVKKARTYIPDFSLSDLLELKEDRVVHVNSYTLVLNLKED